MLPLVALSAATLTAAAVRPHSSLSSPIRLEAPDPTLPGPFATSSEEYRLEAGLDELVLPDRMVEYWAVVWRPLGVEPDPESPLPLAVFLHGNHATCGTGSAPRVDSNSQYTTTGTCPDGFVVVPNHRGYDYIAERLASHGYLAISINANRGINSGAGVSGDARLIKARGALIIGHLALLAGWEREPETSPLDSLLPSIDWTRVGIFGHSRGGEAARCAYQYIVDPERWGSGPLLARLGEGVEEQLRVLAVIEVGAVDYNGRETNEEEGTFDADGAAWVAVVPACDGDVSHLAGVRPGDRLQWLRQPAGATTHGMSATLFVWGTNHNFYSTEWQTSDSSGCLGHEPLWPSERGEHSGDCPECREPGRFATMALFRAVLGPAEDADLMQLFDPRYDWPPNQNLTTTVEQGQVPTSIIAAAAGQRGSADVGAILPLEDFSGSASLESEGAVVAEVIDGGLWAGAGGDPRVVNHDETQRAVLAEWEAEAELTVVLADPSTGEQPLDLSPATGLTHLLCRIQRAENFALNSPDSPTEFGVSLRLLDGSHGPYVPIGDHIPAAAPLIGPVGGPANSRNNFYGYHPILRTVPIPLDSLGDPTQLQEVTGVRLELGAQRRRRRGVAAAGSPSGAILLANLSAAALPPVPVPVPVRAVGGAAVPSGARTPVAAVSGHRFFNATTARDRDLAARGPGAGSSAHVRLASVQRLASSPLLRNASEWAVEFSVRVQTSAAGRQRQPFPVRDTGLSLCAAAAGGGAAVHDGRRRRRAAGPAVLLSQLVRYGPSGRHDEVIFTAAGDRVRKLFHVLHPPPPASKQSINRQREARHQQPLEARLWVVAGECSAVDVAVGGGGSGSKRRGQREGEWPLGVVNVGSGV